MLKRGLSINLAYFSVIWIGLTLLGRKKFLQDDDTIWHSVVGRQILETGTFGNTDTFSFTFGGEYWIGHQWLGECLLAMCRSLAGWGGVVLVTSAAIAWLVTYLFDRFYSRGADPVLAIFFLTLWFFAGSYNLLARPHVVTMVCMTIVVALLNDVDAKRKKISSLVWLIPITWIWSNVHGGALGGLGTIGLVLGGWTCGYLIRWDVPISSWKELFQVWGYFTAATLTIVLTPFGTGTLGAWLAILGAGLEGLVIEHAPLDPRKPEGLAVVILFAIYLGIMLCTRQKPRVTWLLPIAWMYLSTSRVRHGVLFAIAALIAMADMIPLSRLGSFLVRREFWLPEDRLARPQKWSLVAPTVCVVLIGAIAHFQLTNQQWTQPIDDIWPVGIAEAIEESDMSAPIHVFNSFELAGYLLDQAPQTRVFIDSRCELYGEEFLRMYMEAPTTEEQLEEWHQQYQFHCAVLETNSAWTPVLRESSNWELVYENDAACLFLRVQTD